MGRIVKYMITDRCNGNCSYCSIRDRGYDGSMSREDVAASFDVLWPLFGDHFECIHFFGGEPTLRMDLVELATQAATDLCKRQGEPPPVLLLSTNCLDLTDDFLSFLSATATGCDLSRASTEAKPFTTGAEGAGTYRRVLTNSMRIRSEGIPIFNVTCVYGLSAYEAGFTPYEMAHQIVERFEPASITFNLLHSNQPADWLVPFVFYGQLIAGYETAVADYKTAGRRRRRVAEAFLHDDLARMNEATPYFCDFGTESITIFPGGRVDTCPDVRLFGRAPRVDLYDAEFMSQISELRRSADAESGKWENPGCRECPAVAFCHACPYWSAERRAAHCEFVKKKHSLVSPFSGQPCA